MKQRLVWAFVIVLCGVALGATTGAVLSVAQTWTALQTFNNGIALASGQGISGLKTQVAFVDLAPVVGDSGLVEVVDPAVAIHLTRLWCAVQGSTNVVLNLDERSESTIGTDTGNHLLGSDLTAVTGGANTSTFANGSGQCGGTSSCAISAHAPVVMTITSVSGTPTTLDCSVEYTID